MQLLKTFAFVLAAISLTLVQPVLAQDAQVDQARNLLQRGQELFDSMEFADAKSTLLQIEADDLPDSDSRETWNNLLTQADIGLRAQQQGQEDFIQARKLLNAGDFAASAEKFQSVLDNQYIPAAQKKDAKAMLSVASAKAKRQQAMEQPAEVVAEPVEAPAAEPAEVEAEAPAAPAVEADSLAAEAETVSEPAMAEAAPQSEAEREALLEAARKARVKADVRKYIEQGDLLLDANAADKALAKYRKALSIDPDSPEANSGFDKAQAKLAASAPGSSLDDLRRKRLLAVQEAKSKYQAAMSDARQILAKADSQTQFAAAAERARFALGIINTQKQLLSNDEFNALSAQGQDLLDHIGQREIAWNKQQAKLSREEAIKRSSEFEKEQIRQRRMKMQSLEDRAQALMEQQKWDQATEAIEEILRLDPNHAWGGSTLRVVRNLRTANEQRDAYNTRLNEEQKHLAAFSWDMIPWYDLLRYPKDWDYLVRRRGASGSGAESAADLAVRANMEQIKPQFAFDDMEFSQAIAYIRESADVNITVNWGELDSMAGITPESTVTLRLDNVSSLRALEEILSNVGGYAPLGYLINDGVVRISTEEDLASFVETIVYDIQDIIFTVPNFEGPILSIESEEVSDGGGDRDRDIDDDDEDDIDVEEQRAENVQYVLDTVQQSIDPDSWGTTGSIREFNGAIIVTQTPENHRRIADLLDQLRDNDSVQINIEARYITVSSGFLNDVGLTLNFFLNTGSTTTLTNEQDVITGANVVGTGNQLPQWANGTTLSNRFTPVGVRQNSTLYTRNPVTSVPNSIGSSLDGATGLSLAGTFLDDIQVDFILNATQADQRATSFLAPRLTLTNGQRAYVVISQDQAYVSDLEPITDENVTAYDPTITVLSTGNTLDVEAVASADRRYVTMTLRPSIASVVQFDSYYVDSTYDSDGNLTSAFGRIELPITNQTRFRATVKVPDGGTLLVGGERRSGEITKEMGAPVLNKIPFINRLFSNRSMARDEYLTIMLIKPTIIIAKEYEDLMLPK